MKHCHHSFLFFFLFALLPSLSCHAQQLRYGVQAGVNFTHATGFDKGGWAGEASAFIQYQFQEKEGLFLESGLSWVRTEATLSEIKDPRSSVEVLNQKVTVQPISLQIPLFLGYRMTVTQKLSLSVASGLYGSGGLYGKGHIEKMSITVRGQENFSSIPSLANEINNVYKDGYLHRLEWGFGLRVGVEFAKNWRLDLGHRWAMTNGVKGDTPKHTSSSFGKNRTWVVHLGYTF